MKNRISWMTVPYLLLLAYVIYVCYGFYNIYHTSDLIIKYPLQVLQDAQIIKARVNEMRHTLPGLMARTDIGYEAIEKILDDNDRLQNESCDAIEKLFLGKEQYVVNLRNELDKIRLLRRETAKSMIDNSNYQHALDVYNRTIAPQVERVTEAVDKIIDSARTRVAVSQSKARHLMIASIIISAAMGIFIMCLFQWFGRRAKIKTLQLQDREKLFSQLSQNVDEIFIIATSPEKFDYVTTNSIRLMGIDSETILHNPKKLYEFLPETDAQWLKKTIAHPSQLKTECEREVITNNGNRVFRLSVYPIQNNGSVIVALQDKTREYMQQQSLGDALENAHAASVAKSNFLSHMSHEIRTPMNAIIGMTTIALSKINNTERVLDCLGKISESSRHLLGLINDVLDMSKIENGKLTISREEFSLPDSVRNINDLVRPQADERHLEFEIFQENVDEEELLGDPLRLNQVLLNILSNALKFTPPNGTITLKIRQLAKTETTVRLAFVISDTGIGMNKEFLEKLYHPFEQATSSTAAKYGGTGLGMSITFNLVTLMGGTIQVESEENVGTTFTVTLPFGYNPNPKTRGTLLPRLRVLVTDDDTGTCEHATLLLEKMGLSVRWCTSGSEAVNLVREAHEAATPYDVCFVDWKMPDMDGAETARRIREVAGEDMLIIIISAYDWSPIEQKAKEAGVNEFIAKPFFASTLYNTLIASTKRLDVSIDDEGKGEDGHYDFSGKRVLLVEDNEFNREIALEFLGMVNAEVESAENGQEAVDKFTASAPGYYDLILMDVQMPVMDGYAATGAIRSSSHPDAKNIHILAMTANAFSEDIAKAVSSGMNGHIAKPIEVKDLYRLMSKHLGGTGDSGK